jgi:hypothetical protein
MLTSDRLESFNIFLSDLHLAGHPITDPSNHATELSLTGKRGKTTSVTTIPQVRRLKWEIPEGESGKARLFLWGWIFTGSSGT